MLARTVLAVASLFCSIAVVKFAQSKLNRHNSQETLERDGATGNGKENHMHANNHGESEEKEDAMKLSPTSPSSGNFLDNDLLLLPEFNDLCQEAIDITLDSDTPIHGREIGRNFYSDSGIDAQSRGTNEEAYDTFQVLTEENSRESGSDVEIARLNSVIADMIEKQLKLKAELNYYYGLKEQQVEAERQMHRKDEEIKKLNDNLIFLKRQRVDFLKQVEDNEYLRIELEHAQVKIKSLQKTLQVDADESRKQIEDAERKGLESERMLLTLKDREIEAERLSMACTDLQQQNEKLMKKFHEGESKIKDLQQQNEKLMMRLHEGESEIEDLQQQNEKLMTKFHEGEFKITDFQQQNEKLMMKFNESESKLKDFQQQNEKLMTKFHKSESKIKDLQQQNEKLMASLQEAESKIKELSNITEIDVMAKVKERTSIFRQANRDLSKHLEDVQMCRLNEIEEMLHFRRLNTRLRYEVEHFKVILRKAVDVGLVKHLSPKFQENNAIQLIKESAGFNMLSSKSTDYSELNMETVSSLPSTPWKLDFDDSPMFSNLEQNLKSKKPSIMKRLRNLGRNKGSSNSSTSTELRSSSSKMSSPVHQSAKLKASVKAASMRTSSDFESARNSMSDSFDFRSELAPVRTSLDVDHTERARTGMAATSFDMMQEFPVDIVVGDENVSLKQRQNMGEAKTEKGLIRRNVDQREFKNLGKGLSINMEGNIPSGAETSVSTTRENQAWQKMSKKGLEYFQTRDPRIPKAIPKWLQKLRLEDDVVEQSGDKVPQAEHSDVAASLQAHQQWPGCENSVAVDISHVNHMINEIENPSDFLLAVKADIEKQGSFVRSLATEVHNATFEQIEDVIVFVTWLDEELSFLVDEHAVLKDFDWPESKANALREAALDYLELRKLYIEMSLFEDNSGLSAQLSPERMHSLLEKVEQSVYHVLSSQEELIDRFSIPVQWMLDSGLMGKIKLATGQLARKYIKRGISELDSLGADAWTARGLVLMRQAVGFAKRAQQIAGRFDADTMDAFEQLRSRVSRVYREAGVHVSWT